MVWLPGVISIKKKTIKDDDKYKAIAYKTFFNQDVIQLILNRHQLPLIVVDTEVEKILQWIN